MLAVVRLATFHPHFLIRDQHQIALHLVAEVRNLRSTVSRSAIFTIGEIFSKLKSQLEPVSEVIQLMKRFNCKNMPSKLGNGHTSAGTNV